MPDLVRRPTGTPAGGTLGRPPAYPVAALLATLGAPERAVRIPLHGRPLARVLNSLGHYARTREPQLRLRYVYRKRAHVLYAWVEPRAAPS